MRKPIQQNQHGDPGRVLVDESEEGTEMVCVPDGVGAVETVRFVCSAEVSRSDFDVDDENDEDYARLDEDMANEDALYEPGAKVPYSGVIVMANPMCEVIDTERTLVVAGK